MKLKSMYTCITRTVDSDEPYERTEVKKLQAKNLFKSSKRNVLRSKAIKVNSDKTSKSPCKKETASVDFNETVDENNLKNNFMETKRKKSISDAECNNNNSINCIDKCRKFSTDFILQTQPSHDRSVILRSEIDANGLSIPGDSRYKALENFNTPFDVESKSSEKSSLCLNFDTFEDLNSSHDDVFDGTEPNWTVDSNENIWNDSDNVGETEDRTVKLIRNFKLKPLRQLAVNGSAENLISEINSNNENGSRCLSNDGTKTNSHVLARNKKDSNAKCCFLSVSSSPQLPKTSVDWATESFETVRSLCASERLLSGQSQPQRCKTTAAAANVFAQRRALSSSPTTREIPPLIPPRDPVTFSRSVPPQRHASSPSHTSLQRQSPPLSSKTKTRQSTSTQGESHRSKYQTQASTTPVFSALRSSLSRSNPIIRPIMKDGVQQSHTHYYLLGEEEEKNTKKHQPSCIYDPATSIPRPICKSRNLSFNPCNGLPPPRPPPPARTAHVFHSTSNFDDVSERASSLPLSHELVRYRKSSTVLESPCERAAEKKTQTVPRNITLSPGQMVNALQSEVFGVTAEECQLALKQNDWSVSKSVNYLKVEQLFRVGLTTRENCQAILRNSKWDLQMASQMLLEQHQQKLKTRS